MTFSGTSYEVVVIATRTYDVLARSPGECLRRAGWTLIADGCASSSRSLEGHAESDPQLGRAAGVVVQHAAHPLDGALELLGDERVHVGPVHRERPLPAAPPGVQSRQGLAHGDLPLGVAARSG